MFHWLCTRAEPPFATPDDAVPRDGRTPHAWFPCRPVVRPFVAGLATAPRSLDRIAALGGLEPGRPLVVTVAQTGAFVGTAGARSAYWDWREPERYADTLVFLDPDNGFETRIQRGPKWVRHAEVNGKICSPTWRRGWTTRRMCRRCTRRTWRSWCSLERGARPSGWRARQ